MSRPPSSRAGSPARRTGAPAAVVAVLVAGAVVAGCSTGAPPAGAPGTTPPTSTAAAPATAPPLVVPTDSASSRPAPETAALAAWRAGPGEVSPEVKTAAARAVELAGTWGPGADGTGAGAPGDGTALVARLADAGLLAADADRAALAAALAPLADPAAQSAATAVVYPQYGGLTPEAASVMVVAQQRRRVGGAGVARGATLDVRLAPSSDGAWRVTGVVPPAPRPVDGRPSALAREVLASPRVLLPADAEADLRSGLVADEVAQVLLGLAEQHEVAVSVLRTGHPAEVFGTDRLSNHTRGRAVDVWRLDDQLVVDPAARGLVEGAMRLAGATGATEVGGPLDPDGGPGGGFFSDALHADHLHVGLTPGKAPVGPPR